MPRPARALREHWFAGLVSALIAAIAIAPRLAGFQRPFWLDEADHNRIVLEAQGLLDLRHRLSYLFQPILEFSLRKYFWFPLFGHDEWGLRFPSLAVAIVTVFLCSFLTWVYLRERSPALALAAAALLGLWAGSHSVEIYYSAEARHYTFVSLVSLLWFHSYFRLRGRLGWEWFAATSLIFLNSHFFAIPLVAGAWGLEFGRALAGKSWVAAAGTALVGLTFLCGSLWLNYPAFHSMLTYLTVQLPVAERPGLAVAWARASADWRGLWEYFALPIGGSWLWAVCAFLPGAFSHSCEARKASWKWLVFIACILPLHFLRVRSTSNYPFFPRYYMPFFGLAFFTPVLALANVDLWVKRHRWVAPAGLLLLSFWAMPLPSRKPALPPARNFTSQFGFYESLKTGEPLLVLASPCWGASVPRLYWNYIGAKPGAPAEFAGDFPFRECVRTSLAASAPAGKMLEDFFVHHSLGTVMLYNMNASCPPLGGESLSYARGTEHCIVARRGVRSAAEAREFARQLKFPQLRQDLLSSKAE